LLIGEEENAEVLKVLDSQSLFRHYGPRPQHKVSEFEQEFAAAMFAFPLVLQEFVYGLTFISAVGRMTVSLGVPVALVRGDVFYWGSLMAAALITIIPIAIVYNAFIDRFLAGLTAGAVNG